jgi:YtcA family
MKRKQSMVLWRGGAFGLLMMLSGCSRAPSFNILGSFFPSWLLCIVAGIVLASICYWVFVRMKLEKEIQPGIVVYPCLALFFCFTLWLIFFS